MESWEFGRAVRRWRDRVAPGAVGLPPGSRRRATGLRREELAALAGISADYLTRLEQGRATSPSSQVVEALARALRVSDSERELLFELAGLSAPGPDVVPSRISASVQRLLDRIADTPVAVYDATWTLLDANTPYDALMGETTTWRGLERNALWRNFVGPGTRVVHSPEEKAELLAGQVADLRRTAARYPADRQLRTLIRELTAHSPHFADLWAHDDPEPRTEPSKRKVVDHPAVGPIRLDCDVLFVATDDVRLMIYTAEPGSEDAERLALAVVLGTQQLVDRADPGPAGPTKTGRLSDR
ncbi:helix-turn-helix transcriptional regulator [Kribbella sp. GL6]|uniref:helix-turn-helix transcriptional regulator n=1 Tax=Kribbella sp. GL6 TaxID=3419765 RepID=UPI003D0580DB